MKITNRCGLPEAPVKAVTTGRHNNPGRLSATTLLSGTRQIILTDRHWDQLGEHRQKPLPFPGPEGKKKRKGVIGEAADKARGLFT